jgi:hypothetical protein
MTVRKMVVWQDDCEEDGCGKMTVWKMAVWQAEELRGGGRECGEVLLLLSIQYNYYVDSYYYYYE